MILTGEKIHDAVSVGDIIIEPFCPTQLNPNSYNYRLGRTLLEVSAGDTAESEQVVLSVPDTGALLLPHRVYLGATCERFATTKYAMTLLGRSSLGRLGLFLNLSSDLGHIGSDNHWTLEMTVIQPLVVYPFMRVGQVAFWRVSGGVTQYLGRYLGDTTPMHSKDSLIRAYPTGGLGRR